VEVSAESARIVQGALESKIKELEGVINTLNSKLEAKETEIELITLKLADVEKLTTLSSAEKEQNVQFQDKIKELETQIKAYLE
jgi:hypothetical protein